MPSSNALRYVTDNRPGITRKRRGKHFAFYAPDGRKITDTEEIKRIKSLAIPPAYEKVWICPFSDGHLQATGIDKRGRKQYRYHPLWRQERDANKFEQILYFGEMLPAIRKKVERDSKLPGLGREKVLATVVQLLEKTLIRVGNAEYAKANRSYGLTTLHNKHVNVSGSRITFKFTGKSGKQWNLSMHDRRIASIIKRCEEIPGQELFKYVNESGEVIDVTSSDVNMYLKEISGENFTAKDYRTWSGTVLATLALRELKQCETKTQVKKNIVAAIEKVAKRLGNTPSICRKCYIHPEIINAYLDGEFVKMVEQEIEKEFKRKYPELEDDEILVLSLLQKRLRKSRQKNAA